MRFAKPTRLPFYYLVFLCIVFSSASALGDIPFKIDIDFAQFRYNDDTTYLEIYYLYDESQLTYGKNESGEFEGAVLFHVSISSAREDSLLADRWWRVPHIVSDTATIVQGKTFIGVMGMTSPNGMYVLKIATFDDNHRSRRDVTSYELPEKPFGTKNLMLSDLQLSSSIRRIPGDESNIFYKNTFEVIPNPSGIYGIGAPVVFYYIEAYNLLQETNASTYQTKVSVYDSNNRELITQSHTKPRINQSSVEVGTVNVNSLPSGSYKLVFSLIDSATNKITHSDKRFFVYNPHQDKALDKGTTLDTDFIITSDLDAMNEEELDEEFEMASYVASRYEKSQYRRLVSVDAKREFLSTFWKRRDTDPGAAIGRFRLQYMTRVQYANIHFGSGMEAGWKSDRGRVFIVYGEPNEYEQHVHEARTKPYEIWYYDNIQGGVRFVFVDLFGFQDYELVHSTHKDELQDYNWRTKIRD